MKVDRTPNASCARCNCPYGSHGFHDMIIPDDIWHEISPSGDDGGLLCPTCILAHMDELGLTDIPVYFASGPARISSTVESDAYCKLWQETKLKLEQILNVING